jgi:hypothetical protein
VIEAKYVQRVEVQQAPDLNMMTNPNAQTSLVDATSSGLTSLVRQTAGGFGSPHDTAFRLNGSAAASDSFMVIGGAVASVIALDMQVGVQYTVSGTVRIDAPLTGTANARARRVVVFHRIGAAAFTEVQSPQAPNVAGNHRVSATFTLPAGTTEAFIRFYHGHASTSVLWWHSLRLTPGTQTDYIDGSLSGGYTFADAEYGWDRAIGESTSWRVNRAQNVTIPEAEFTEIRYDLLQIPIIQATIVAPLPATATLDMLEPRRSRDVILNFSVIHYVRGVGGNLDLVKSSLPLGWPIGTAGKLWLRDVVIDYVAQTLTMTAASGEVRFEDKIRLATNTIDTAATTVQQLWDFALTDAGEIAARGNVGGTPSSTPLPAGDRRVWLQGETLSNLFESELSALDYRTYVDDLGRFTVNDFLNPPFPGGAGTETLTTGDSGTVTSVTETRRRDDWRDGTLVKAQYNDSAGVQQTAYQRYPTTGTARKGALETTTRAIPATNYAQAVNSRARRRGSRVEVEALLDFNVRLGRWVAVTGIITDRKPERITYRPREGTMTIGLSS